MARVAIELPALGFDMETGKLGSWLKAVGDTVRKGDAIAEVETEKATVDLEAPSDGTLVEIVVPDGTDVAVGTTLAYLDDGS
jgi:pyruvate/2-oxoglutarate dehydrogenase complex dihydrolipoamide acyltransferase (E2) component